MTFVSISGLKAALYLSLVVAAFFAIGGGFLYGYTSKNLLFFALTGMFIGAIGAPELEPNAFRSRALWQMTFAVLGCLLFAFSINATPIGYAIAVPSGLALGYLAPHWVKHVQGP